MKDLGVKIGSKEEAAWTKVLRAQEETSINAGLNKEIADTLVKLAKERIAEEKTGRKDFPLVLAERGIHVYKDQAGIRNQN